MSLQDEVDAYKALPNPDFRPEFGQIAGRTIAALIASGQASRALQDGDRATTFDLPDPDGRHVVSIECLKTDFRSSASTGVFDVPFATSS